MYSTVSLRMFYIRFLYDILLPIIATTSVIKSESECIASASNTCVLVIIPTTYLSITNTQFPKKLIIKSLNDMCLRYIDKNKIRNDVINNLTEDNKFSNKKELEVLTNDIKQINNNLDVIYIDKINKKITLEQFERVKIKLENELNIKRERYNELNDSINDNIDEESKNKMINEYINKFLSMKEPSRELIINLIDRIEIFEDKRVDIRVTFKSQYLI